LTATHSEQDWLDSVRARLLRKDVASAQNMLVQALAEFPESVDLRRIQAGIFQQTRQVDAAEQVLCALLTQHPGDSASAFALAQLLKEQGRTAAAANAIRTCLLIEPNVRNPELAIAAIELLDDMGRKADAGAIAEAAVAASPNDARLHAYAGMLAMQVGAFESARRHYLSALEHDPRAWEWHVPIGLSSAQRYADKHHPDFALFRQGLQQDPLSDLARAELHFASAKAHDDIHEYAEAARQFRAGNAIAHRWTRWSRKAWRRAVEARLSSPGGGLQTAEPIANFTPVFIVGMPRSGTTLLAELLASFPQVCNRGELPWLAQLATRLDTSGLHDAASLRKAAMLYARHSRQDDAPSARWFLDKQPLNFRYLDLALALFPDAKIIFCRRNPRDNALSLWTQCFQEDVQGYSYDFHDIALVMGDCGKLMAQWQQRFGPSIREVRYEELVSDPGRVTAALAEWIGLSRRAAAAPPAGSNASISTASLWQARQPVYSGSVDRWKHFVHEVPELLQFKGS
jgi:tetratricopeptide (TPR) repeat protein